jgi:hypothetical protein
MFEQKYDEFDKILKVEYESRITFSTFKTDDGTSWIGDHIGFRWSDWYYNKKNKQGWSDNYISLNIWGKIQKIKDCYEPKCWQFSDTGIDRILYDYKKWKPYMKGEIDELEGYSYIQFLTYEDTTLKIYLKYDDIDSHIILNNKKYKRSVDNYNWLLRHSIKKIRFHDARENKNLDIEIPKKNKEIFMNVLYCIDFFREDKETHYKNN